MSGAGTQEARRFAVVRRDARTGTSRAVATVLVDAMGMMEVLSVEDDPDGLLRLVVEEQNGRPAMNVGVPPPPQAPRFALASRTVERGSEEFLPALADYLRRYYGMELQAA